jgi:hypothetical protein
MGLGLVYIFFTKKGQSIQTALYYLLSYYHLIIV